MLRGHKTPTTTNRIAVTNRTMADRVARLAVGMCVWRVCVVCGGGGGWGARHVSYQEAVGGTQHQPRSLHLAHERIFTLHGEKVKNAPSSNPALSPTLLLPHPPPH